MGPVPCASANKCLSSPLDASAARTLAASQRIYDFRLQAVRSRGHRTNDCATQVTALLDRRSKVTL